MNDDPLDILLDNLARIIDGIHRGLSGRGLVFWGGCLGLLAVLGSIAMMVFLDV